MISADFNMQSKLCKLHIHASDKELGKFEEMMKSGGIPYKLNGTIIIIQHNDNVMKFINMINQTFKIKRWGGTDGYTITDKEQGISCYVDLFCQD